MEGGISTLALLCLVLAGVGAITVSIPQKEYECARGDNITLPCSFLTTVKGKSIVITWSIHAEQVTAKSTTILSYFSSEASPDISPTFEGRVSLDYDLAKGKADLKLYSVTLADNKVYECHVLVSSDKDGTQSDTAQLVVLVAPSTPNCRIQGKAEYGQNINLTCLSEEGSPPPTYKWDSRDVNNMPRVADPRTTDKGGILSLYNISKDTSGYFICTSTNKIRSASCNITLAVMPPSINIGSTAGIIGGVAASLFLLVIIIYCCCRRKKKKEEEYAMRVHEEEYHDKELTTNGESRRTEGQEDIRSHDAPSVKNTADPSDHYEDRRSDYEDRRSDYNNRRSDYDDRRSDYDDRRSDYDDRRSDYNNRRSDYDDRRDRYSDRDDDDRRYDDERRNDGRRDRRPDEPYDDRDRNRPPVPALKPPRRDYKD